LGNRNTHGIPKRRIGELIELVGLQDVARKTGLVLFCGYAAAALAVAGVLLVRRDT
jgi:hypothetical protein